MGQREALRILKENGDWMTALEVTEKSDACRAASEEALRKLYKNGEVLRKQIKVNGRKINAWRTKER